MLGLFLPEYFSHLRPFVPWLFGLMTFSGALQLTASELGAAIKNPVPILLFFFSTHIIMPLAALGSSSVLFNNPEVITGFVLLFAGPTAVSGFIWVVIFKGDKALSLTLILIDTLLAPAVVPATISILMGAKAEMDMSGIAVSLCFMVVIPTIIAVAINEISRGKIPKMICPAFDPFAKLCLITVIAANSSAVAHILKFNDLLIWGMALLCVCLTTTGFILARLSGIAGRFSDQKCASLVLAGGLRNNSAVMTIAVAFFPEAAVIPGVLSILFQQTVVAIVGKILIKKHG